jgi:hypothetical protein
MVQLKLISNNQVVDDNIAVAWSRAVLQWQAVLFYGIAAGAQIFAMTIERQCDRLR